MLDARGSISGVDSISSRAAHSTMERQAWLMVAVLFTALAFVFGGIISTPGVFFAPLITEYGWSHARVSSLASAVTIGTIPGSVAVGFVLERVDSRIPIVAGAALAAGSLLCASESHSYMSLLIAYFFAGFGVAMATLLPASLVVANWFQAKRGLAMGVAIAGVAAGGMIMVQVATAVIRLAGWRAGYAVLALPIWLIVIPLVVLVIRTRPGDPPGQGLSTEIAPRSGDYASDLAGFNLASAIGTRSFWLIAVAGFLFAFIVYGILTQLVVYLLGVGYRPAIAAIVLSLILGLNAVGKIFFGIIADHIGPRLSLTLSFALIASGIVLLFGSNQIAGLVIFLLVYGPAWGAPLMLLPLITIESLGLKHYASLGGILRIADATGAVLGPVVLGRIFDLTGSYHPAFRLCILCAAAGAAATLGCQNYSTAASLTNNSLSALGAGDPL
jgi:MFS family permease